MGRQTQHTHSLTDGTTVGYSLTKRPGGFRVRFIGPDGKRAERATGCRTKGEARDEAKTIIDEAYRPALPVEPSKANWETVLADLDQTPDLRPDSIRAYRTAVKALREMFPELLGPADVTVTIAHRFKLQYQAET